MDVSIKDFEDDYFQFRRSVKEIKCCLGAVICLGLSDCTTVYGRFQLLNSFDNKVLSCLIIRDELESKYIELVQSYGQDLKVNQELFLIYQENPSRNITKNFPPITGVNV